MTFRLLPLALACAAAALSSLPVRAAEEINALVWCDHTADAFHQDFTTKTGIALARLEQSKPGVWDVFVVDSTDVRRVVERGLLAELTPKDLPLADVREAARLLEHKTGKDKIAVDDDPLPAIRQTGGALNQRSV